MALGVLSLSKWIGINNTFTNNIFLLITISLVSIISFFFVENTFRYKKLKSLNSIYRNFSIIFSTLFILFPLKKFVKFRGETLRDITSKTDFSLQKIKIKNVLNQIMQISNGLNVFQKKEIENQ